MGNPFENRPNEQVLIEQRNKYIDEAVEKTISDTEGLKGKAIESINKIAAIIERDKDTEADQESSDSKERDLYTRVLAELYKKQGYSWKDDDSSEKLTKIRNEYPFEVIEERIKKALEEREDMAA